MNRGREIFFALQIHTDKEDWQKTGGAVKRKYWSIPNEPCRGARETQALFFYGINDF